MHNFTRYKLGDFLIVNKTNFIGTAGKVIQIQLLQDNLGISELYTLEYSHRNYPVMFRVDDIEGYYIPDSTENKNYELGSISEQLDKSCTHEFVDIGFTHSKMVCKHCNEEEL